MESIQYQGAPVSYQITGAPSSLPTLVLLHGFLEDSRMWDGLIEGFDKLGSVVRIDLPGHGRPIWRQCRWWKKLCNVS